MKKLIFAVPALFVGMQVCALADVIPAGTEIPVRTDEQIYLHNADRGRIYTGRVIRDVQARDGDLAIPRGSTAELIVREEGPNDMVLDLQSVTVNGRRYVVDSNAPQFRGDDRRSGIGQNERTAKYVGGGALLGTIIGAIAGGGKGAAIGALSGAAAGGGAQVLTRGGEIRVPAETVLTYRLDAPLRVVDWKDPGYRRDQYHYHDQNDWYR